MAGTEKPVGIVTLEKYYLNVEFIHCTKEEAVLCLCVIVAAELERQLWRSSALIRKSRELIVWRKAPLNKEFNNMLT